MPVLAARRDTNAQIELVNQQYIQESPYMLIVGSILGALGFFIAVIPYILRVAELKYRGDKIKADDIPDTVSALVSKWDTPEARIFFGFELSAAFCILMSWYPYRLRGACRIAATGGCRIQICCFSMHWATFRQFVPPVGLVLLTCCPTVPMDKVESAAHLVLIFVHCLAAMMMFVGFLMAECHALSLSPDFSNWGPVGRCLSYVTPSRCRKPTVDSGSPQYRVRFSTWKVSAAGFQLFLVLQGVLLLNLNLVKKYLWIGKGVSFGMEVIAGLAMLANHAAIWYYTPERHWSRRGVVGDWSQATVHPVGHGEASFAGSQQALSVELAPRGSLSGGTPCEPVEENLEPMPTASPPHWQP